MDRSRSKRYYYDQDYDPEPLPRTKQRYNNNNGGHFAAPHHRRAAVAGGGRKLQDPNLMVTTSYRILCHDIKAGGVIGKSGSIIKAIRQHTGAWINMHELIPGDEERIIEISDTRRRDPEGRMPSFSPAQEALFLVHERILESDAAPGGYNVGFGGEEEDEYGPRGMHLTVGAAGRHAPNTYMRLTHIYTHGIRPPETLISTFLKHLISTFLKPLLNISLQIHLSPNHDLMGPCRNLRGGGQHNNQFWTISQLNLGCQGRTTSFGPSH